MTPFERRYGGAVAAEAARPRFPWARLVLLVLIWIPSIFPVDMWLHGAGSAVMMWLYPVAPEEIEATPESRLAACHLQALIDLELCDGVEDECRNRYARREAECSQ